MKILNILAFALAGVFLISCSASKKFKPTVSEDKPLFEAINELVKHPDNQKAVNDLKNFYAQSIQRHEQALEVNSSSSDEGRWDRMLRSLNALQHIHNSVMSVQGSSSLIRPKNYEEEIRRTREEAAEYFYDKGRDLNNRGSRQDALAAYQAFQKAGTYVSGYKDTERLAREAYDRSVIYVVINPIEDNRISLSGISTWGNGFRYRPEEVQLSLVRDLDNRSSRNPARFLTDRQAYRDRIQPDLEVNMAWRDIDVRNTRPREYQRQVSRQIQIGQDTSGKAVYRTVYATLFVTQMHFTARGEIEYDIRDMNSRRSMDYGTVYDDVSWSDSYATYRGDSRALSQEDWIMINNNNRGNNISQGDVLQALMRELYPRLRQRLEYGLNQAGSTQAKRL